MKMLSLTLGMMAWGGCDSVCQDEKGAEMSEMHCSEFVESKIKKVNVGKSEKTERRA